MGIASGSLSVSRYRLLGKRSRWSIAQLSELLAEHRAGPIKLSGVYKEEVTGWVRPLNADDAEVSDSDWDMSHARLSDGYLLRLRVERRKVPASLVQAVYREKFLAIQRRTGKMPTPKDRRELREEVKKDLMAKALPSLSHIDAYWRDRDGDVLLFATGKGPRQRFEAAFAATFGNPMGQTLVSVAPPLAGLTRDVFLDSDVATETLGRLSLATPVSFAAQELS
jgi:DNA recombination-dependent growth factor C